MSIRLCDGIFWFPWHRLSTWHRRGSMASAMAVRQRGAMARNAKRDVMVPVGFFSWENHHVESSENGGPSLDFLRSGAQKPNIFPEKRRKIT